MKFYELLTDIIVDDYLNKEVAGLFNIEFLNNTEFYNKDNLAYDNQIKGVSRLVSTNTNPLSDAGATNRIDIMQVEVLIPLDSQGAYRRNVFLNGASSLNNVLINSDTSEAFENTEVLITNIQLLADEKLDGHINGVEYERILIQMQCIVTVDFVYSNKGILTIDNVVIDCKAEVILGVQKMLNGKVNSDGFQVGQNNGIQYSLNVILTYNANNTMHKSLLADWTLGTNRWVSYKLGNLNFNRHCQITSYTMNAVTGDTVKLSLTFQEV